MTKILVALGFLAVNFYTYNYLATSPVIPERTSFQEFPLEFGPWSCSGREFVGDDVVANLGVTDYLLCTFVREDPRRVAGVYVGYHATQVREEGGGAGENSIHPPAHCLPGSGWDIIESETVQVDFEGLPAAPARVKRLITAKGEERLLTYYWYQSRGRVIAEDWRKVVYVGLDRGLRGRTDGSLVRFTVPIVRNQEDKAEAAFRDLAPRLVSLLPAYVPE